MSATKVAKLKGANWQGQKEEGEDKAEAEKESEAERSNEIQRLQNITLIEPCVSRK